MGVSDASSIENKAREEAIRRGWTFERVEGDLALLNRLLQGDWNSDYLILNSGQKVEMAYNDDVVCGISE